MTNIATTLWDDMKSELGKMKALVPQMLPTIQADTAAAIAKLESLVEVGATTAIDAGATAAKVPVIGPIAANAILPLIKEAAAELTAWAEATESSLAAQIEAK